MTHVALLLTSLLLAAPLMAQHASVRGTISDPGGAPIPGAAVSVTNLDTGVVTRVSTDGQGMYALPYLPSGNYRIMASSEGFAPVVREGFRLEIQQAARIDLSLPLGTVTETVEVGGVSVLLDSETSTMGQVIENKQIVEMPLNKRNYLELARLSPGAIPSSSLSVGARTGGTGGFVGAGSQAYQTSIVIDGVDNTPIPTGGAQGQVAQASTPSLDAVSEYRVVTNNYSAEYGFRMGPQVIVSLKSGTNRLHGTLYEFLRNDVLDGANFFANRAGAAKPSYRQNQFGGVIGGPIRKDKTFFFFSYEGTRIRQGNSFLSTVPSGLARSGDFSREPLNMNSIYDPLTTSSSGVRQPFAGNLIPATRLDPVTRGLIPLYPSYNVPGREFSLNNYFSSPSTRNDVNQYDTRIDHNLSARHRLSFRHSLSNNATIRPSPLPVEAGSDGGQAFYLPAQNLGFQWIQTLRPNLTNETRFGYLRFHTLRDTIITEPLNAKYGILNAPGDSFGDGGNKGFTSFTPAGYANLGTPCCEPNYNDTDSYQFYNNLAWQKGRHMIKTGAEHRRMDVLLLISRLRRGQFAFTKVYTAERPNDGASRTATGNGLADMLLGWANRTMAGTLAGTYSHNNFWAGYIQDDWKVHARLTINAGLRWEYAPPSTFPDGGPKIRMLGVSNYLTELNGYSKGDPLYNTFLRPNNGGDCGCKPQYDNFAPRLGFALRLRERTVVRAGAGLFYGLEIGSAAFSNQTPDGNEVTTAGTNLQPAALVRDGLPLFPIPALAPVVGNAVSSNVIQQRRHYVSQWFFDLQHQVTRSTLITVGYVGSKGSLLPGLIDLNFPGPHPSIPAVQRRLDPRWIAVSARPPWGNSNYNAFTVRAERRYSAGFTLLGAYTWSHNIDNVTEFLDAGFNVRTNPYNWNAERANSNLDNRHVLATSLSYGLPWGRGRNRGAQWNAVVDALLGNWQLGGILTLRTGLPFEVSMPGDLQNTGTMNRGNRIGSGMLANPTIDRWFDESAFVASAPGVYGNTGRNVLFGPGTRNLDVSISKRFALPLEGHTLQFRAEAFNSTNTPKFGQPNGGLRSANTATINTADEPRRVQFGLKYVF
jgi:hypothetical protein